MGAEEAVRRLQRVDDGDGEGAEVEEGRGAVVCLVKARWPENGVWRNALLFFSFPRRVETRRDCCVTVD